MSKRLWFLVVLAAVAGTGVLFYPLLAFDEWTTRGQFGDAFGAFSSLLSLAALFTVAYTLHLQTRGLKLLQDQIAELKRASQREALISLHRIYREELDRRSTPELEEAADSIRRELIRLARNQAAFDESPG